MQPDGFAAADRVNADVRAAENAATMRRVAIEIDYTLPNNTPLLSPTRTLLQRETRSPSSQRPLAG